MNTDRSYSIAWLLAVLLVLPATVVRAQRNDDIFPAQPAAQKTIAFDGRGFIINGQRTFISSGSIHYPRVPRALWADRLLRMKQGSFNTVETYAFWNYHERREGEFDFTGDGDIGAFFEEAQKLGLYGIARVGPYVCAEWDFGGYPVWMKFKDNVVVRTDNPQYLALNDRWYDHVMPIVAAHQINRGGNIILVQLENEHPKGWGRIDAPYFKHLTDKAIQLGLEVPHFMSGLNHGPAPSGPKEPDTSKRHTPWFSTEFWSGWFNLYGPVSAKKLREVESAQWSIMARGGAGQNFYMLHGGSNFETWNDPSGAASYDYGAAIGQAGDLRPMYYKMKRANQLAQSFPDILADGADVSGEFKDWVAGGRVSGARRSQAGTIVFITNGNKNEALVEFKDGAKLRARANETSPVVINAAIARGLKIAEATVRVLAVARYDNTVTVVVHGQPGDTGKLTLAADAPLNAGVSSSAFSVTGGGSSQVTLTVRMPERTAEECLFRGQDRWVRVVAVSSDLGLYTWLVGQPGRQHVVCGPGFVRDLQEKGDTCSAAIERSYGVPSCNHVAIYGPAGRSHHLGVKADLTLDSQPPPALTAWQMSALRESDPGFDDSSWKKSDDPQPMGFDGDNSAFAWYRADVTIPAAGSGTLTFRSRGKEYLAVFVNGKRVPLNAKNQSVTEPFALKIGKNVLAVFATHSGRNKAYSKMDNLSNLDNKGLYGPVTLTAGDTKMEVKGWRLKGGVRPNEPGRQWIPRTNADGAPVLFKTSFSVNLPGTLGAHPIYRADFKTMTRGTMWLNGHNLGRYPEKIPVSSLYLPECWIKEGANELVVLDEDGADPGRLNLVVEKTASREVIRVSEPVAAATPIAVPTENPPKNLAVLNKDNLAFRCPAAASVSRPNQPAGAATDGDIETPWTAPTAAPGAWLSVDLGRPRQVRSCEIVWEQAAKFYEYKIEASQDGRTWGHLGDQTTAVPTSPDSPSELTRMKFPAVTARYVRVTVTGGLNKTRFPVVAEFRVGEN